MGATGRTGAAAGPAKLRDDLLFDALWDRVLDDPARRMLYRMTLLRRPWEWDLDAGTGRAGRATRGRRGDRRAAPSAPRCWNRSICSCWRATVAPPWSPTTRSTRRRPSSSASGSAMMPPSGWPRISAVGTYLETRAGDLALHRDRHRGRPSSVPGGGVRPGVRAAGIGLGLAPRSRPRARGAGPPGTVPGRDDPPRPDAEVGRRAPGNGGPVLLSPGPGGAGHRLLRAAPGDRREIGDRRGEGAALGNLGLAYADLGQVERAIDFYEQAPGDRSRDRRPAGRGERPRQPGPRLRRPGPGGAGHRLLRAAPGDRSRDRRPAGRGERPRQPGHCLRRPGPGGAGHRLLRAAPGDRPRDRRPAGRGERPRQPGHRLRRPGPGGAGHRLLRAAPGRSLARSATGGARGTPSATWASPTPTWARWSGPSASTSRRW